jgi:hypothetical protein
MDFKSIVPWELLQKKISRYAVKDISKKYIN